MKVALFAPELSPVAGGTWQFYQWVAKLVELEDPLLLLAPSLLIEEIHKGGGDVSKVVPYESFRASVEATITHQIIQERSWKQITGLQSPIYQKIVNLISRTFFNGNVVGHAFNKLLKKEGVNVIHIPVQWLQIPSAVKQFPYIINPHDYQHEHFPEFFTKETIDFRRTVWYKDQREAAAIVVHSQQTRSDTIKYLGVPEERVFYAPYGPLDTFPEPSNACLQNTKQKLSLPERFVFYPANSWPHKNHLALIDAIYQLKKRGIDVNAIFTVVDGEHGKRVKQRITDTGLETQITIVGRVSPEQMGALYSLCTMVVVPSLFEQNSGPMLEAIHFGKAVAVSHIKEVVSTLNGAGLLFDPFSIQEIVDAIDILWSSNDNLKKAEFKIKERRAQMSWQPFREIYKQAYSYASR